MKILIVDDHPVIAAGCRRLFEAEGENEVLCAVTCAQALSAHRHWRPTVSIIDINLPDGSGFDLTSQLLVSDPHAKILIFTMHDANGFAFKAMQCGAMGHVGKCADPAELVAAVSTIAAGGTHYCAALLQHASSAQFSVDNCSMSERELEVLRLLLEGLTLMEVSGRVGLSYKTVTKACARMRRLLGADNLTDLVRKARAVGVI